MDVEIPTYNIDVQKIESAISEKTKCIFLAHTLGNPFDLDAVLKIAEKYKLWLIEDNCDAFGSTYKGRYTGTFGHLSTLSFYPAHHITTGEGGAVLTKDDQLAKLVRALETGGETVIARAEKIIHAEKDFPSNSAHCLLDMTINMYIRKSAIILK